MGAHDYYTIVHITQLGLLGYKGNTYVVSEKCNAKNRCDSGASVIPLATSRCHEAALLTLLCAYKHRFRYLVSGSWYVVPLSHIFWGAISLVFVMESATHITTSLPLNSAGARGRHRFALGLVDGPSSTTKKETERQESVVICLVVGEVPSSSYMLRCKITRMPTYQY